MKLAEERLLLLWQYTRHKIRLWQIIPIGRTIGIDGMHSIQPETVNPSVKPEAGNISEGFLYLGMRMVQIGLAWQKIMQIILLSARLPAPCPPAKK